MKTTSALEEPGKSSLTLYSPVVLLQHIEFCSAFGCEIASVQLILPPIWGRRPLFSFVCGQAMIVSRVWG